MRSTTFQSESAQTHTTYDRAVAFGLIAVAGLSLTIWAAVALLIAL
ncbi:hypothetical protein [Asticcacaulis sp. AND118]|nr:hypothetical protein [Asticcacaulis sp. AND118]UDF02790.1 hypothetical protein LH365_10145 [Asticcacaulis sp. AND118]